MAVWSDRRIRAEVAAGNLIIDPFEPGKIKEVEGARVVSFGTCSYGYNLTIADAPDELRVINPYSGVVIDPKRHEPAAWMPASIVVTGGGRRAAVVPPNNLLLARSRERVRIPRTCIAVILGQSTNARCGLVANTTPIEPGWEGYITLEISNTTPLPALVYLDEGIGQMLILEGDQECQADYGPDGKYQGQRGMEHAKV